MNIASAMSVCGATIQRAFQALPDLLNQPAPEVARPKLLAPGTLSVVYRCNKHDAPTTCHCGNRFAPQLGIWPFAVGSDRPVCSCCDSVALDVTTDADLRRSAAQAEFLFHVDSEITIQTIAALRSKRLPQITKNAF